MQLLQIETTATAVVARLEQTPDELEAGITRLRWSSAGHPPPMVVGPDGAVSVLAAPDPQDPAGSSADLLLGMDPETDRSESEVTLPRGSTVLLFTDGLVERRDQSVEEGVLRLQEILQREAGRPLEELCDAILAAMLDAEPEDDVAIAAVRLHPQDGPRPPDAGPVRVPERLSG
jgi:serine phosphatase RsbU (regulator of sigma subunit)